MTKTIKIESKIYRVEISKGAQEDMKVQSVSKSVIFRIIEENIEQLVERNEFVLVDDILIAGTIAKLVITVEHILPDDAILIPQIKK